MSDEIKSEAKQRMGKAIDAMAEEFEKVRTGALRGEPVGTVVYRED